MDMPKSVADWKPTPDNQKENSSLMNYDAKENSDMANGTNVLEQFTGKGTKSAYGELGRRGHNF